MVDMIPAGTEVQQEDTQLLVENSGPNGSYQTLSTKTENLINASRVLNTFLRIISTTQTRK